MMEIKPQVEKDKKTVEVAQVMNFKCQNDLVCNNKKKEKSLKIISRTAG